MDVHRQILYQAESSTVDWEEFKEPSCRRFLIWCLLRKYEVKIKLKANEVKRPERIENKCKCFYVNVRAVIVEEDITKSNTTRVSVSKSIELQIGDEHIRKIDPNQNILQMSHKVGATKSRSALPRACEAWLAWSQILYVIPTNLG